MADSARVSIPRAGRSLQSAVFGFLGAIFILPGVLLTIHGVHEIMKGEGKVNVIVVLGCVLMTVGLVLCVMSLTMVLVLKDCAAPCRGCCLKYMYPCRCSSRCTKCASWCLNKEDQMPFNFMENEVPEGERSGEGGTASPTTVGDAAPPSSQIVKSAAVSKNLDIEANVARMDKPLTPPLDSSHSWSTCGGHSAVPLEKRYTEQSTPCSPSVHGTSVHSYSNELSAPFL